MRHRIWAYRDAFADVGITLTVWPFMTPRFYAIRRRFGRLATVLKAVYFLLCTARLLLRIPRVVFYDAVIVHREVFPLGGSWCERVVARLNPNLIVDVDDAIWAPPSNGINQRALSWNEQRIPELFRRSRAVVVGNAHLAAYAEQQNDHVVVIPTCYDDLRGPVSQRTGDGVPVVVWIGNLGNVGYVRDIVPALEAVHEQVPFRLRLIGGEDIRSVSSSTIAVEYHLWSATRETEGLRTADIGIMPLCDAAYERGKCAFKLVQYFSAGLPVVASPVGMNAEVVEPGITGFLAADRDEWVSALTTLLGDATLRRRMGARAYDRYQAEFTRRRAAQSWIELIACVRRGPREAAAC